MLSDEQLLALYHRPDWPGSYSGVRVFKMLLYTDFNEDVSEKRILNLLKEDPNYLIHQRRQRKYPLRSYDVQAFGELVMLDLAFMFPVMGFKYFLLLIDVFSRHIYCEPLKRKTAAQVGAAIEKILAQMDTPIQKLQTDQGTEFIGNKALFKKYKIRFTTKHLTHKASFSEQAIYLVKRKLYRMMREKMDNKWPNYLQIVVDGLNEIPRKKLGFIAPAEINSLVDGAKVFEARKDLGIKVYQEPDYHTQNANQDFYEHSLSKFQVGTFVYLDNKVTNFTKSFDTQRGCIYTIHKVDSLVNPPLYQLKDLQGTPIKGRYYQQNLTLAPKPSEGTFFEVQKILKTKVVNGERFSLVKFLYYPNKFNLWVPDKNMKEEAD